MPICDAYISEGALSPSAERQLLAKITDLFIEHEGVDPTNETARKLAWVFESIRNSGRSTIPDLLNAG